MVLSEIVKFPRGDGPLVSILLPTRKRVSLLCESVDSLFSLAIDHSRLELIVKVDDDDKETIKVVSEWAARPKSPVRMIVSPRGNGYHDMHLWVNEMSKMARGDWLIVWNDDAKMVTGAWDEILSQVQITKGEWHGVTDVACLVLVTSEFVMSTAFFFLRRKVVELLGRFSYTPHVDTWTTSMMRMVGSCLYVNYIQVQHRAEEVNDEIRKEALPALQNLGYTVMSKDGDMLKLLDAVKLQNYIDIHKGFNR